MTILTTTIGSYPKPDYVPISDWFPNSDDEDARKPNRGLLQHWQKTNYEERLKQAGDRAEKFFVRAAEEVIRDQTDAGIDIPTDGEVRRENYIYYQCRHIDGIDFSRVTPKSVRDGAFTAELPTIVGPVKLRENVLAYDWKVSQALTDHPLKITLPGPMTIVDSTSNDYYDEERKLCADLAAALNVEIRALADAGCRYIQVDEPVFARKPDEALSYGIEALERCFHGIPENVVRTTHMCCGYPNALDVDDYMKADPQAYFMIADAIDSAAIDAVSIEDAHRHNDLKLLEHFKKTSVILGVIAIAKSRVESVDEIRERLEQALEHIDAARLIAAPDCGLGLLGRDLAIQKLKQLCKAARSIAAD